MRKISDMLHRIGSEANSALRYVNVSLGTCAVDEWHQYVDEKAEHMANELLVTFGSTYSKKTMCTITFTVIYDRDFNTISVSLVDIAPEGGEKAIEAVLEKERLGLRAGGRWNNRPPFVRERYQNRIEGAGTVARRLVSEMQKGLALREAAPTIGGGASKQRAWPA